MIEVLKILENAKFPVIDFKFQNRGHGTAWLWQFSVCVDTIAVDRSPVLRPFLHMESNSEYRGALGISIRNDGWGSAERVNMQVASPLRDLFPSSYRTNLSRVDPGKIVRNAILLSHRDLNSDTFHSLWQSHKAASQSRPSKSVRFHEAESVEGIPIHAVDVEFSYEDSRSAEHKASVRASTEWLPGNAGGSLYILHDCFVWHGVVSSSLKSIPTAVYYVSLDPDGRVMHRQYPISHTIPPGATEHFSIMLGSAKSCIAKAWFEFKADNDQVIKSEKFSVTISNPQNEAQLQYRNGDDLSSISTQPLKERSRALWHIDIVTQWDLQEFKKSAFPFLREESAFPFLREEPQPFSDTPCPHCGQPLRTPKARQCRFCHADWHSAKPPAGELA